MLVSIIIPIYNAASYLEKCLNSVINQTYTSLEIILINDGSTDNSGAIINKYKEKDNRIVVFHKTNGGIGSAYKVAFEIMTGDYVLFVDSDDWLELNAVDSLLSLAIENNPDMVSFGIRTINDEGVEVKYSNFDNIDLVNMDNASILQTHFEVLKHPTLVRLYKKELFNDVIVFEQNIGIDEMLTPQLLNKCSIAVYTSDVYYNILLRGGSVSRNVISKRSLLQISKVYHFLIEYFQKNILNYKHLILDKYAHVLFGYFGETLGKVDFELHALIVDEYKNIKTLQNDVSSTKHGKAKTIRNILLQVLIVLPKSYSFGLGKFIYNAKRIFRK